MSMFPESRPALIPAEERKLDIETLPPAAMVICPPSEKVEPTFKSPTSAPGVKVPKACPVESKVTVPCGFAAYISTLPEAPVWSPTPPVEIDNDETASPKAVGAPAITFKLPLAPVPEPPVRTEKLE